VFGGGGGAWEENGRAGGGVRKLKGGKGGKGSGSKRDCGGKKCACGVARIGLGINGVGTRKWRKRGGGGALVGCG